MRRAFETSLLSVALLSAACDRGSAQADAAAAEEFDPEAEFAKLGELASEVSELRTKIGAIGKAKISDPLPACTASEEAAFLTSAGVLRAVAKGEPGYGITPDTGLEGVWGRWSSVELRDLLLFEGTHEFKSRELAELRGDSRRSTMVSYIVRAEDRFEHYTDLTETKRLAVLVPVEEIQDAAEGGIPLELLESSFIGSTMKGRVIVFSLADAKGICELPVEARSSDSIQAETMRVSEAIQEDLIENVMKASRSALEGAGQKVLR